MFGDPIANSKDWRFCSLSDTCTILTGNTPSRKEPAFYGDYIEWIKSDNIVPSSLYLEHATESLSKCGMGVGRVAPEGSILMTCIAGSPNTIGNIAIANRDVAFNQQINAFIPHEYETLFLYYLLQIIQPKLREVANKALKCILNKSTLESINVIVPNIELQKQFATIAYQSEKSKFATQPCTLQHLIDAVTAQES